jgi:hypothetical protein
MNPTPKHSASIVATVFVLSLYALTPHRYPGATVSGHDAFSRLKTLAGEWVGTVTEKDTGPAVKVVYSVTAGGSVVEERLFPGTSHEMVTMYHLDGDRLVLTHYCAIGNQPRMTLAPESTSDALVFEFVSGTNFASPDTMHMHSGRLRLVDADTLEAAWDVYDKGAKIAENRLFLTRGRATE